MEKVEDLSWSIVELLGKAQAGVVGMLETCGTTGKPIFIFAAPGEQLGELAKAVGELADQRREGGKP